MGYQAVLAAAAAAADVGEMLVELKASTEHGAFREYPIQDRERRAYLGD